MIKVKEKNQKVNESSKSESDNKDAKGKLNNQTQKKRNKIDRY